MDSLKWTSDSRVEKFSPDQVDYARAHLGGAGPREGAEPTSGELWWLCGFPEDGIREDRSSNLVTTAGLHRVTGLALGVSGVQAISATATRLGVGNGSTAAVVGNTDLAAAAGATNRQFKIMDSGYPQRANGVMTFKSTFDSGEANFDWNEWGIDVGAPTVANGTTVNALLLNRKVSSNGTKASGAVWVFTVTVTLA